MQKVAVIVDDHPMCRQATGMALKIVDPDIAVVEAASLDEARHHAATATLMTLDLGLPDSRGVRGLAALREDFPDLPLIVISGAIHPGIERQVAAMGAHGYLSKAASITDMVAALKSVLASGRWFSTDADAPSDDAGDDAFARLGSLTAAQGRVLDAMEGGRLNKQIAYDLGLSEITVKAHVKAILKKLGVPNRTQAILMLRSAEG